MRIKRVKDQGQFQAYAVSLAVHAAQMCEQLGLLNDPISKYGGWSRPAYMAARVTWNEGQIGHRVTKSELTWAVLGRYGEFHCLCDPRDHTRGWSWEEADVALPRGWRGISRSPFASATMASSGDIRQWVEDSLTIVPNLESNFQDPACVLDGGAGTRLTLAS